MMIKMISRAHSGTNLIIVKIAYTEDTSQDCEEELDRQITSFHPTGIAVSTLESVLYQMGTYIGQT